MKKILKCHPKQAENLISLREDVRQSQALFVNALNAVVVGQIEGQVKLIDIKPNGVLILEIPDEPKKGKK